MMHVASIYTVFSQRCGAEMLSERLMYAATEYFPDIRWTVFCNREGDAALRKYASKVTSIYVPWLDNQFTKAVWLEYLAGKAVDSVDSDVFWNPSGCNHFPGRWRAPTVTTFLDLAEYRVRAKYDFKRRFFRRRICIPRSLRRSAALTAISRYTAQDMVRFLGVQEPIPVIYCGPSPHLKPKKELSAHPLDPRVKPGAYFLVPGRTDFEGKGLDVLLAAHDELGERWPDGVHIVFVGPPGIGHNKFLAQLQVSDAHRGRLFYFGRVEEAVLDSLYAHCLATVIPSRSEGFGFPVLEAMEHGVPVVCSNAGSLPEVAGNAALVFESGNHHHLGEQLKSICEDLPLREKMVEWGRLRSRQFSWEECARETLAVLAGVAGVAMEKR